MTTIGSSVGPSETQTGQTPATLLGPWVSDKSPVKAGFGPAAPGDTDEIEVWAEFESVGGSEPELTIPLKRGTVTIGTAVFYPPLGQLSFHVLFSVRYVSCGLAGSVQVSWMVTPGTIFPLLGTCSPATVDTTNADEYDVACVCNEENHETIGRAAKISVG